MKRPPYTLAFTDPMVVSEKLSPGHLPQWCTYPMSFAQQVVNHNDQKGFEILQQQFGYGTFFIDLVEVRTTKEYEFMFNIEQKQVFLFFMREGVMDFLDSKSKLIARTVENNFLMSYYGEGHYHVGMEEGKHIALVVTIQPDWLETVGNQYRNIYHIVTEYKKETRPYLAMFQTKIDRRVHHWLQKVYKSQKQDFGIFDGFLRMHMALMLKHYDTLLAHQGESLAERTKEYLDIHYCDSDLSVQSVAAHFSVTARTLHNHFKKEYGMGVRQHYTKLRVIHALKQMEEQGLGIKDIYMEVGYLDDSSLRRAINRYLGGK